VDWWTGGLVDGGIGQSAWRNILITNTATKLCKMVNWQNGKDNANELAFSTISLFHCRTNTLRALLCAMRNANNFESGPFWQGAIQADGKTIFIPDDESTFQAVLV
jgi:hypothetical protein